MLRFRPSSVVWPLAACLAVSLTAQAPRTLAQVNPAAAVAAAPAPPATSEGTVQVFPAKVQLDGNRDSQRVLALATDAAGATVDVTATFHWRLLEPSLAEITTQDGHMSLRGCRDGAGTLVGNRGQWEVRIDVSVRHAGAGQPISFADEVLPVLTRSGCNAGACHGAAAGKNGFGLSLFGYDPERDYQTLTRDLRGRRLDVARPDDSLMLQKATAKVAHKGGKRFDTADPRYHTLRTWIAEGAVDDTTTAAKLDGIEVLPDQAVLIAGGSTLPLMVRAHYADGSDRDVTDLALWSSNNEGTASIAADGTVTAHTTGEACILARFGGNAVVSRCLVLADREPFTWPDVPAVNFVDHLVHQKLRRAHVLPAGLCSDAVFARRVFLDLLGILPTPAEAQAFVADEKPDKRDRLVDALLQRPEFAAMQAMSWAEILQVDDATMEPKGAALLTRFLEDAFASHRPFDAVVRELLTAEGPSFSVPAVDFYLAANQPNLIAEKVSQNFLGIRIQCAQCHNHPFENWRMDDYYGFAAFFGQLGRKRSEDPYEWIVFDRRYGEVRHKRDNSVAPPRFLGGGLAPIPKDTDRRAVLAEWLTSPKNPWFAANVSNRVWARLFGRGIVDPPDDVRVSNPASHPVLLQRLAALLVENHFDTRPLFAVVCKSRTYQLARQPEDPPPALFAGNHVRRLTAEQLLDAIGAVTGVPTRYPGVPLGAPASEIAGGKGRVRFLDMFGRPTRESACTCERRPEPTLGQALHLINGDTIAGKVADKNGRLRRALAAKTPPAAMLQDLFLAAYSRPPTPAEQQRLLASVQGGKDQTAAWEDVYWAVLNSKEFLFQH
jgi:Protein of unknown function (DUF1549)/Protein of unknown function (DUF1553)/Bacterial Ig-like domain (group 2)